MLRRSEYIAALVAGLLLAVFALPARADDPPTTQPAAAPAARRRPHTNKKKDPAPPLVLPPLPAGPLQQVPLPQLPESAPQVTYQNGLLTILAQNATLGEILKQVKQLTGASIDLPANGAPERVVTQIGPGAPRDVLAVLLNGSQFNYVMLGSTTNPSAIESILLTPKPNGEGQGAAGALQQNAQALNPMVPQPVQPFRQQVIASAPPQAQPQPDPAAEADDTNGDEADDNSADDSDQAQPAQPAVVQPGAPTPFGQQPADPNQPNAGPKTPEQLLQMMRQGQQPSMGPPGVIPAPQPPPQQ